MKNILLAFRSLFKKKHNNGIKILSLGVGLSIGLLMIAKAYFETSFNNFYPDVDRIVYVTGASSMDDDRYHPISGAIGQNMALEIPEVEVSTRYKVLETNAVFFTQDRKRLEAHTIMGDSCLFDVISRPIIAGNAKDALARPRYVLISETLATTICGTQASEALGQIIRLDKYPSIDLVVGGVFEDNPENTTEKFDMVISLETLALLGYDGSHQWRGYSEYNTLAKLYPGVDRSGLDASINNMVERHLDKDIVEKTGVRMYYYAKPFGGKWTDDAGTKRIIAIMIIFASIILFVAVMNYILVVLSSIIGRSKEVAVRKCYGAEKGDIAGMMFSETFIHFTLALILAAALLYGFRGTIMELFGNQLFSLFTPASFIVLGVLVLVIFFVSGFIPVRLYSRIPIAVAFRNYTESRRYWKLVLLFCQFACTTFFFTLLVVVMLQYNKVKHEDVGYQYDNVVFCNTQGISQSERENLLAELRRLPFVEKVATCSAIPCIDSWGGNYVTLVDSEYQIFQIDDFYSADEDLIPLLNIQIIDGENFKRGETADNEILVSEKFATMIAQTTDWTGSIVGREIKISSHGVCVIRGVYSEIRFGESGTGNYSEKPTIFTYSKETSPSVLVKMTVADDEHISQIHKLMQQILPNKDFYLTPYDQELLSNYAPVASIRKIILICTVVSLLLSMVGLLGYINDEINRRKKELAIRRINGATSNSILKLFQKGLIKTALPSVVIGSILSLFLCGTIVNLFRDKIRLSFVLFALCGMAVLILIVAITLLRTLKAASENPVKNLKAE